MLVCSLRAAGGVPAPDLQLHAGHVGQAGQDHQRPGRGVEHLQREPGGGRL